MNTLYQIAEWILIVVLIVGGISLLFADPITSASPFINLLGSKGAGYVYFAAVFVPGACLLVSKIGNLPLLHKHSLMSIYLVSIWLLIIEVILLGFTPFLFDQIIVGTMAGACWLRWKLLHDYRPPQHKLE